MSAPEVDEEGVLVPRRRAVRNLVLELATLSAVTAPVVLAALVADRGELAASFGRTFLLLFLLLLVTVPIRPSFFGGGSRRFRE